MQQPHHVNFEANMSLQLNDSYLEDVSFPKLDPPGFTLLVSGGPTNPSPRPVQALTLPLMDMFDSSTDRLLHEIQSGLKALLGTGNEYTLALHGSGLTGMGAVLDNLIIHSGEEQTTVLICATGYWGDVAANVATRLGGVVAREEKPPGEPFTVDEVRDHVIRTKPDILYMVHGDSTTGLLQRLDGIGEVCTEHNVLFVADVVATLGQQPVEMDKNGIDAVFANSQKGLGGIVGLAPVSFSSRAMERIQGRALPPRSLSTDILRQGQVWNIGTKCGGGGESRDLSYLHSMSLPLHYMLREALGGIFDEGLDSCWARHKAASDALYSAAQSIGLECIVPREDDRLGGTALFRVPQGKDVFKIKHYIKNKYQVAISAGFGHTLGKAIRIGLFGANATSSNAEKIVKLVGEAIDSDETNL